MAAASHTWVNTPALHPKLWDLTMNHQGPSVSPYPPLHSGSVWSPFVGQLDPAPGAEHWEMRRIQRRVATATGKQWLLLCKVMYGFTHVRDFACLLPIWDSELPGTHWGSANATFSLLSLFWGSLLGFGYHLPSNSLSEWPETVWETALVFQPLSSLDSCHVTS